jgi:hypothetical protein
MASTDQSVLLAELFVEELDFSESDPTCKEGFRVVYAKEVPFEMRLQETEEAPQEVGTLEAILAKVAVQGDPAAPTAIKVELSSESDLFFHYSHVVDERAFKQLREEQRLMIEFNDYANVLARSLNQAIKEPQTHLAVYIMNRDGQARLDFIQNMECEERRGEERSGGRRRRRRAGGEAALARACLTRMRASLALTVLTRMRPQTSSSSCSAWPFCARRMTSSARRWRSATTR